MSVPDYYQYIYGVEIVISCWMPVARACDPTYSGGRDQEDHSSKPAQANSSTRPYLEKKPSQK
jgi:hypothetical protein